MRKIITLSITLFLIIITAIYIYFQVLHKPIHQSISAEDVADIQIDGTGLMTSTMNEKLNAVVQNPKTVFSSNPYDYTKDNEDYKWIVKQGDEALKYMLHKFEISQENGLREYIMAIACSEILGEKPGNKKWSTGRDWYKEYTRKVNVDIRGSARDEYIAALDSFMPLDEGLNGGMKYIAVDGSTLEHLSGSDRKEVLRYFEKYGVKVMDASLEKLKEMGLFNEKSLSLDGILLSIKKVDINSRDKIIIEGSKYRSGLGAIGVKCALVYKDGKWQVENAGITWIS